MYLCKYILFGVFVALFSMPVLAEDEPGNPANNTSISSKAFVEQNYGRVYVGDPTNTANAPHNIPRDNGSNTVQLYLVE